MKRSVQNSTNLFPDPTNGMKPVCSGNSFDTSISGSSSTAMPEPPDVEAPPTDRPAPEPTPPWDPLADEPLPDVPGLGSLKYHYNGHKKKVFFLWWAWS